jgi:iron complex outermembrane receptor protein
VQDALDKTNPDEAFNPFGDGLHNSLTVREEIQEHGIVRYNSAFGYGNVTATGPVPDILPWPAFLTIGADCRLQTFSLHVDPAYLVPAPETNRQRTVLSGFTQLDLPILRTDVAGGQRRTLDLSLSARYEHYSDVGQAFAPRLGIAFSPWRQLAIRGSWARLFRAPSLSDLTESNNISALFSLADPSSKSGYTTALVWTGNNADLRPETVKSWSLGVSFSPLNVPQLSIGLTYYDFVFSNRIEETTDLPLDALSNPTLSWLVTRHVTPADLTTVCQRSEFIGVQTDCTSAEIGALVDMRLRNIQALKTNGLDFTLHYQIPTSVGLFKYGFDSTRVLRYAQSDTPTSPIADLRNTPHNPPGLKFRNGLEWTLRGMWIATFVNYQSGYDDPSSHRAVSHWTTVDATLGIAVPDPFPNSNGETRISIRGLNILNKDPPVLLDTIGVGYDHENGSLRGRVMSIALQRRW